MGGLQADVIILDEATSALDDATENAVMQAIDELDSNVTLLIIAHRPLLCGIATLLLM